VRQTIADTEISDRPSLRYLPECCCGCANNIVVANIPIFRLLLYAACGRKVGLVENPEDGRVVGD
jgi:hypothetical protein